MHAWNHDSHTWDPCFRRPLRERELIIWFDVSAFWNRPTVSGPDQLSWNLSHNGAFTVRSLKDNLYNLQQQPPNVWMWYIYGRIIFPKSVNSLSGLFSTKALIL